MNDSNQFVALGLMSGTSLDGLDLALCRFQKEKDIWKFEILGTETRAYSINEINHLLSLEEIHGDELIEEHINLGKFYGKVVKDFLNRQTVKPDLIASHGHTIFHQPELGFTFQAGDGQSIANETGIETISDFRSKDVSYGGQGAPLVPIGDLHLFKEYQVCLNLGGFANASFKNGDSISAHDICAVNYVLNKLAIEFGEMFDRNGNLGKSGKIDQTLLSQLNSLSYYRQPPPKSLGREWVEKNVFPVIYASQIPTEDKLRTCYEHFSGQIANSLKGYPSCLVTGGGTYNDFLMELIQSKTDCKLTKPSNEIIEYKEAIIFAFLGILRKLNIPNCLAAVTGATKSVSGGVSYLP